MSEQNTGGPAFPVSTRPMETEGEFGHQDSATTWQYGGMTLRDYFAAKAMQGLLACPLGDGTKQDFARLAYEYADAMLKARQS